MSDQAGNLWLVLDVRQAPAGTAEELVQDAERESWPSVFSGSMPADSNGLTGMLAWCQYMLDHEKPVEPVEVDGDFRRVAREEAQQRVRMSDVFVERRNRAMGKYDRGW